MKNIFTLLAAVLLTATTFAQVGIGTSTPHASAALDLTSTTGGLLLPRMTDTERQAISIPVAGLMVYVTDLNGGSFMFYDGNSWSAFISNLVLCKTTQKGFFYLSWDKIFIVFFKLFLSPSFFASVNICFSEKKEKIVKTVILIGM